MDWSEQRREGFALAAAARDDRGAARAASGLCADIVAEATSVAARLAAGDTAARRRWLHRLLRVDVVGEDLGRRWPRAAPLPRPGYVPEPRLLALLRKLVAGGNDRAPPPTGGAWRA